MILTLTVVDNTPRRKRPASKSRKKQQSKEQKEGTSTGETATGETSRSEAKRTVNPEKRQGYDERTKFSLVSRDMGTLENQLLPILGANDFHDFLRRNCHRIRRVWNRCLADITLQLLEMTEKELMALTSIHLDALITSCIKAAARKEGRGSVLFARSSEMAGRFIRAEIVSMMKNRIKFIIARSIFLELDGVGLPNDVRASLSEYLATEVLGDSVGVDPGAEGVEDFVFESTPDKETFASRVTNLERDSILPDNLRTWLRCVAAKSHDDLHAAFMPRFIRDLIKANHDGYLQRLQEGLGSKPGQFLALVRDANSNGFVQAIFPQPSARAGMVCFTTSMLAAALSMFFRRDIKDPNVRKEIITALEEKQDAVIEIIKEYLPDLTLERIKFTSIEDMQSHPILLWACVFPSFLNVLQGRESARLAPGQYNLLWQGTAQINGRRILAVFFDATKPTFRRSEAAQARGLESREYAYNNLLSVRTFTPLSVSHICPQVCDGREAGPRLKFGRARCGCWFIQECAHEGRTSP